MGFNYLKHGNTDEYHKKFPQQPGVGTEECATTQTRGTYADDRQKCHLRAYDWDPSNWGSSAEQGWTHYAERPWLAGIFVWTGFDYRGEPTPYSWPNINSHFGILDMCGFPKDNFYYYQAWWTTNTVLHLLPHWNWPGREGHEFRVDALSNCKEVELFLNGESFGKKAMKPNSKLTWKVKYAPGTLSAKGYDADGKVIAETKRETTGEATTLQLTPDRKTINADGEDVSVFTVAAFDAQGRFMPVAQNKINFALEGAGKIIGVGNGDPSCHEPDTFVPNLSVRNVALNEWRWKIMPFRGGGRSAPEYATGFDDSTWNTLKAGSGEVTIRTDDTTAIYRARLTFTAADLSGPGVQIHFTGCDDEGWYFVNGQYVGETHDWDAKPDFDITKFLRAGDNVVAVCCRNGGAQGGLNPNVTVDIIAKPGVLPWSRSLFNGLAQIIVQSTKDAGEIKLTASTEGLAPATTVVNTQPCAPRPSVP
jgi:beta-galactosidase